MKLVGVVAALLVAIGISLGGWFIGTALVESRQPLRTVTVKGLSERAVQADLGFWPIRFVATGPTLQAARTSLEASEASVRGFLGDRGFAEGEIQVQNVLVEDRAAGYNAGSTPDEYRFVLTEDMLVTTDKVTELADASRSVADLLRQGVVFSSDSYSAGASFVFTNINDLKSEMLTEATTRAKETAAQFATESGAQVGDIQTANQGVFEVLPAVEIPNDRPEKQIDKKVRVVTTITYFLVD
ncbi:SIMPL domain-containing protein [Devosia chinhatensis]|uniref:SIMPL domain-containing protein n=1 Tax=Devosia chinhatensis TaxID=429727 RepID=A0A0F5FGV5_9HYPH|nr:SIMPL domain-containing protein [Devosia chinhatensis]KKB08071.1 hypothetical protein VE26_15985 [Devosia chinhatensis]